jgi:hypothetical protein
MRGRLGWRKAWAGSSVQVPRNWNKIGVSLSLIGFGYRFACRKEFLIALSKIFYRRRRVLEEGRVRHSRRVQLGCFCETPLICFLALWILYLIVSRVFRRMPVASAGPQRRHPMCVWRGITTAGFLFAHWRTMGAMIISPVAPSTAVNMVTLNTEKEREGSRTGRQKRGDFRYKLGTFDGRWNVESGVSGRSGPPKVNGHARHKANTETWNSGQ